MRIRSFTLTMVALSVGIALSACGGGGGGSTSSGDPVSTSREITSVGVITGFGSIFVNGVEFETPDDTDVSLDDAAGDDSDLRVGMVVTVTGQVNADGVTGTASVVEYDDELEGVVVSNEIAPGDSTGTLTIMGQTVTVTLTTTFESHVAGVDTVDQIAPGQVVEVSGFADGNGNIEATRIEVKAANLAEYLSSGHEEIEVKGVISGLDSGTMTFQLGGMTVDYSGALLDDMPAGGIADGLYVEVKSVAGIDDITGYLVASKVELEDGGDFGHDGEDGEDVEIKGVIASDFDGTGFLLNGTQVLVTDGTEFDHIGVDGLLAGTVVKVEGVFDADGNLVADEIEAEEADEYENDEIEGMVMSVVLEGVNTGTIILADGTEIHVTNDTVMEDDREDGFVPDMQFNLEAIGNGDYIEADVYVDADGQLVAIKIEREDADDADDDSGDDSSDDSGDDSGDDSSDDSGDDSGDDSSDDSGDDSGDDSSDDSNDDSGDDSSNP